ncbi:MAG TPA: phosphatidylserine decarboxylase family protein [Ignavibacteriaceae bacterium]|nr:phosphatidylserine decarboxylase family protein [Ignavibacteriaceae bacterium]
MLTKYGYVTLGIISILVFILISISFFVQNSYLKYTLIIIPIVFLLISINFFRDPGRTPPDADNVVVSPADGTVLFVKEVLDNKFINKKALQISIFMSPLNVHVNRIPISGTVEYLQYIKGKYIAAFEDKASVENERSEFGIQSKFGKVFFTQVAGFIARRIVYEINKGDTVTIGKRFGMIKFGSRVDVVVSQDWKVKVKKDDKVTAGETILFVHKE